MFIQVIQGRCNDADRLKKQLDLWEQTIADGADGWLGSTGGVTDDGTSVAVVRFESRAAGRRQLGAPGAGRVVAGDGQPASTASSAFPDYDDAFEWLGGGSDDAGFVQVMRGKVANADGFRAFSQQPMDGLQRDASGDPRRHGRDRRRRRLHPDHLLHLRGRGPRGGEAGDARGRPARRWAEAMGDMGDITYLDLRDPWFSGRA